MKRISNKKLEKKIARITEDMHMLPYSEMASVPYRLLKSECMPQGNIYQWTPLLVENYCHTNISTWYDKIIIAENAFIVGCEPDFKLDKPLRYLNQIKPEFRREIWSECVDDQGIVTTRALRAKIITLNQAYRDHSAVVIDEKTERVANMLIEESLLNSNKIKSSEAYFGESVVEILMGVRTLSEKQFSCLMTIYSNFLEAAESIESNYNPNYL
jgi:hypothetical protein